MSSLHVLAIPHTIIHPYFNICSFTKNTWSFMEMMKNHSPYNIIYYGAEESQPYITENCDEFIPIYNQQTIFNYKPLWRTYIYNDCPLLNSLYKSECEEKIKKNYKKGDIIIHTWFNYPLSLPNYYIQCCINIGCFTPVSTPYRSYVSYSCMSTNLERQKKEDPWWFDRVIPPSFNVKKYPFMETPSNYFVFLGRIIVRKGIQIIFDLAKCGIPIVIIGPTNQDESIKYPNLPNLFILNEIWNEKTKLNIISSAKGLICPTIYNEPFGMVSPEAQLCGTPVISSDWGGFVENNEQGKTGYRCRNFNEFLWACNNIHTIDRKECRKIAISKYSYEKISSMYHDWFKSIKTIYTGKGFYDVSNSISSLNYLMPLEHEEVENIFYNSDNINPSEINIKELKLITFKPQHYMEIFRNIHKGKTGWLMCTGPGLNTFIPPNNTEKNNIYFGVNSIIFNDHSKLIDYYFLQDPGNNTAPYAWTSKKEKYKNFKPHKGKFYSQYIAQDGTATLFKLRPIKILTKQIEGNVVKIPDPSDLGTFSSDITDYINSPGSVSFTALQFMLFMGITDIQIVGVQPHINGDFNGNTKSLTYKDLYHYDYWYYFAQWLNTNHPQVKVTIHENDILKEIFNRKENIIKVITMNAG